MNLENIDFRFEFTLFSFGIDTKSLSWGFCLLPFRGNHTARSLLAVERNQDRLMIDILFISFTFEYPEQVFGKLKKRPSSEPSWQIVMQSTMYSKYRAIEYEGLKGIASGYGMDAEYIMLFNDNVSASYIRGRIDGMNEEAKIKPNTENA